MTSPGARYSAGTAILDVVPVFEGVQEAIRKKAKAMEKALGSEAGKQFGESFGDEATKAVDRTLGTTQAKKSEQQGREAGSKYAGAFASELKKGLAAAQREVKATLKLTADDKDLTDNLKEIEKTIKRLNKAKIGIDLDAEDAMRTVTQVRVALGVLQEHAKIDGKVNFGAAYASIEAVEKRIKKLADIDPEVEVKFDEKKLGLFERKIRERLKAAMDSIPDAEFNADVTPAMSKLQTLRAAMGSLGDKRIGVDIGGQEALREMAAIGTALEAMRNDQEIDVRVRTDAAAAAAELARISALVELVDGKKAEVKVDLDEKGFGARLKSVRAGLLGADADGRTAADGFRAFNAVVLAGAAILPAVAPALAGIAGGLALLGPLALGAAGGLAVMGIGFSGIGDAVSALGKAQETAGKDAEAHAKKVRSASRSVEDAERAVGRARQQAGRTARDAARQVEDAIEAQRDAEEALGDAQKQVRQAQEDLTRARKEAAEQLEDLQLAVRGGTLAERDAVLDLKEAQEELAKAREEGVAGDELARYILQLDQAQFRLDSTRESNADLAAEQAEWARTGVEGSERVVAAREGVATAERGVQQAMEQVGDAARGVQDAILAQSEANADAQQAISDAQRNLTQAQEDYTTAVNETSASQEALAVAMGKLGPAGQEFALFWSGLLPQFRQMRDLIQAGMFPGLQDAITQILTVNGPQLRDFLGAMGQTLGDVFRRFGEVMTSPQWQSIWATFSEYAPIFFRQFAEIGMNILTFFGELFGALAPSSERFGDALIRITGAWADWAASLENSQTFQAVMGWLFENGGKIFDDIWGIIKGIGALFVALLPLGMVILDLLGGLGDWLASLDPSTLGAIVTVILGLVIAFQLAVGAISLVAGALTIASVPLAAIIFAIVAVGVALVALYLHSETFRDIMDAVFRAVGAVVSWVWENITKPTLEAWGALFSWVVDAIGWAWENVLKPVFQALGDFFLAVYEDVLKPTWEAFGTVFGIVMGWIQEAWERIGKPVIEMIASILQNTWEIVRPILQLAGMAFEALFAVMMWAWDNFGKPMFGFLIDTIEFLWKYVIDPIVGLILDRWAFLWGAVRMVWDTVGKPVFDFVQAIVESLVAIFSGNFDELGKIWSSFWDSLKNAAASPVNFVIKFVLNDGLFKAFNWVIDTLKLPADWKIGNMGQVGDPSTHYAAGGRVAGWSPHDKADNIPAMLTANEFVQPVNVVDHYGVDAMELIRKKKVPREVFDPRFYANGGLVELGRRFQQMGATVSRHSAFDGRTPTSGHGKSSLHYVDRAIDVNTRPGTSALEQRELTPMAQLAKELGFRVIFMSKDHYNHLHVDDGGGSSIGNFFGGIGGAISDAVSWVGDAAGNAWNTVTDVFGSIKDSVVGPIKDLKEKFGDGVMGKVFSAIPENLVGKVWDKAKDAVGSFFSALRDDRSVTERVIQTDGGVQNVVKAVAARYGWDNGNEWDALYTLVQKESSWNPNAQNPTSTAYGLFQFLNGTWGPYGKKTSDPAGQAQAGLAYIMDRYGSPSKALAFHNANNWYSEGGEVTDGGKGSNAAASAPAAPTLYDTGGWLPPGITTVLNATNRPEPVLTGQQWDTVTGGRDDDDYDGARGIRALHLHEVNADLSEAIDKVNHTVRVLQRGGRY